MKHLRFIAILMAVLLLSWLVTHLTQPTEPSYQGRTLSNWLGTCLASELDDTTANGEALRQATQHAVREMGTNAIPALLRWAQAKESPWKSSLNSALARQNLISFRFQTAQDRQILASAGFAFLGNEARAAVPALASQMFPEMKHSSTNLVLIISPPPNK
jgi:hypothetical protein